MHEPLGEPSRSLYRAFVRELEARSGRSFEEACRREVDAVFEAAAHWAKENGIEPLTRGDIELAEMRAGGSADYGQTWAAEVAKLLFMHQNQHARGEQNASA